ncbi:hypothetical protein HMPREF9193_01265 [Treponema lecithinolyticum ATCC 700332]|uniref:Uncharacterized protein n=1 Tax=Treponema lecithinolyticum ATCC 700332 TaxID=1321815 RepID=A0ABN0NYT2_TRELE|nr:hypothetical protein HMPREF9193_01265 [Treponema lecithinolyticum ATCC 700332]
MSKSISPKQINFILFNHYNITAAIRRPYRCRIVTACFRRIIDVQAAATNRYCGFLATYSV